MVYLHNGILRSREKEGAYALCNSMDGTGEHYVKWNKQVFFNCCFLLCFCILVDGFCLFFINLCHCVLKRANIYNIYIKYVHQSGGTGLTVMCWRDAVEGTREGQAWTRLDHAWGWTGAPGPCLLLDPVSPHDGDGWIRGSVSPAGE